MEGLIKKRSILWILILAFSFIFTVHTNAYAKKIVIKISTVQMPRQQMGEFSLKFAKVVSSDPDLKDKVEIKVYPSAQLYSGKEELEALTRGELEMAFVIGSKPEVLDPAFQILNLPFIFPSLDVGFKVLASETGKKYLWSKLDKHNIKFLGIAFSGTPVVSNSKHPILMPDDFKGLKMRSYGRISKSTLEALGATCIVTASEETFGALQQGMIDGLLTPNAVYMARKYYTIQKYVTDTGTMNLSNGQLFASAKFWAGLPDDVRSKLETILDKMIAENNQEYVEKDKQIFKEIEAKGNEVSHLTPEQTKAWKEATRSIYTDYGPEIGEDVIEKIEAEVERLSK